VMDSTLASLASIRCMYFAAWDDALLSGVKSIAERALASAVGDLLPSVTGGPAEKGQCQW
jgi:hypothetical protein